MKIKDMNLTELRTMSFTDIAYMILKEEKKKLNTPKLFRKVCDLLEYSDEEYETKIGDFYTSLTTDCRFIILDTAEWDLKDKHIVKETVDEDEDEEIVIDEEEVEEDEEELEEESIDDIDNVDDVDDVDDDMDDLSIIEDEEEEEES
ncbi:MAG: DNA-directed RNA polymerase subunit delta [Bacilli bacterium]|nr:DNA-directed RNA polymerase subunit delta [Bacilli bacterium]